MWVVVKIHTYGGRENASPNSKLKQPPHYKIKKIKTYFARPLLLK